MAAILVTGGNRGIGFAIAKAISTRLPTSTVIVGCRSEIKGQEAIEQLKADGVKAKLDAVELDIESDSSITAAAAAVEEKYGKLDVLINNAIKLELTKSDELSVIREASNKTWNNAVTSNTIVTRAFIPLLRKSDWPRVIMVSTTRGSMGRTANRELPAVAVVDYCVAKAALNMITLHFHIAEEQKKEDERISFWAVSPGHCKTGFNGFRGVKDPLDGAEVVMRLLEAEKGAIQPGTFWELEDNKFQEVPW